MFDSRNPLEHTHKANPPDSISRTVYHIAGIQTTVYGLNDLPENLSDLAVLWLLHPRLTTERSVAPIAAQAIHHWNSHLNERAKNMTPNTIKGLIAVSFDQRNHGTRMVNELSNEAWKQGNQRHAQDMYTIYRMSKSCSPLSLKANAFPCLTIYSPSALFIFFFFLITLVTLIVEGTAWDTSLLLDHLGSYLPSHLPSPCQHLVLGISLGGHSAWHCILMEPRITTAIIIIGCPDFTRLMCQRASKSRLASWNSSSPPGTSFLGSTDFPSALIKTLEKSDPASVLLPNYLKANPTKRGYDWEVNEQITDVKVLSSDYDRLVERLNNSLKGKVILNLSGGADKLVPYACGETFFRFLREASEPDGWWKENEFIFDDRIFEGVGHEITPEMAGTAVTFIGDVLAGKVGKVSVKSSRI